MSLYVAPEAYAVKIKYFVLAKFQFHELPSVLSIMLHKMLGFLVLLLSSLLLSLVNSDTHFIDTMKIINPSTINSYPPVHPGHHNNMVRNLPKPL